MSSAVHAQEGAEKTTTRREERDRAEGEALAAGAPIDPMSQILLPLGPRNAAPVSPPAAPPMVDQGNVESPRSVEHLMARLVRRIAWSGNARTGVARLELGAGALEGATLTIHADEGAVRVALELPPGIDGADWKDRIARRLGARGLQIEALEVG
jgi:hypothetical protein